jgi:hypothetical protein
LQARLVRLTWGAAIGMLPQLLEPTPHCALLEAEPDERAEGLGVEVCYLRLDRGRAVAAAVGVSEDEALWAPCDDEAPLMNAAVVGINSTT